MTSTELITLDELANYLKVSRDTVYRMAQSGKIPGVKVGNQWRFTQNEVMASLKKSTCNQPKTVKGYVNDNRKKA